MVGYRKPKHTAKGARAVNATENPSQPISTPRPIESASASTQPQANSSRFAYILTASILGLITLLVLAITLLLYTAFTTYYFSSDVPEYLYEEEGHDAWGPEWEWDEDEMYLDDIDGDRIIL